MFPSQFTPVNFASEKPNLGFTLMNQLSVAEKIFPKGEPDVAQDFFSLRKLFAGKTWKFTEGRNLLNPASHGDIAWAGALASHAAEQGGNSVAFAGIGRATPNFSRALGVGAFRANAWPL